MPEEKATGRIIDFSDPDDPAVVIHHQPGVAVFSPDYGMVTILKQWASSLLLTRHEAKRVADAIYSLLYAG